MKKYNEKFSLVLLGILLVSFTLNSVFASTLVDQKKAYDICMKYHPPRIQGLCSQIGPSTTFEEILGEHNRGGSAEVEAEKENMIKTDSTSSTQTQDSTTSSEKTDTTTQTQDSTTSNENTDTTTQTQDTNNVQKPKPTAQENQILAFAYSS